MRDTSPLNPYKDCHLMVSNPEKWIDQFAKAGANGVTFHIEVCDTESKSSVNMWLF